MKKIVILANMTDHSLNQLKKLKDNPMLKEGELHLVHVFKTEVFVSELSPYFYPDPKQQEEIEKTICVLLQNLGKDLQVAQVKTHVFFHNDPKLRAVEYLEEVKPDLVVVATQGKHGVKGLFHSSFAEYLNRYSPCDIYIQRP